MDVTTGAGCFRSLWLAFGVNLAMAAAAQAAPMYTLIDLGLGNPAFGVDAKGDGTVTGSNGQTYVFNPTPNASPEQWSHATQGVPLTVQPSDLWTYSYGNPLNAFSDANLIAMNPSGLAAGIDTFGVKGHYGTAVAFVTQLQPDGSWGPPTTIWSGQETFGWQPTGVSILGITPAGQVLGVGNLGNGDNSLLLYDPKTTGTTDLSIAFATFKTSDGTSWLPTSVASSRIDAQGRVLVPDGAWPLASPGGPPISETHTLLLVPPGVSSEQVVAPEPTTLIVFAGLMAGWAIRERSRSARRRARSTSLGFPPDRHESIRP